VVQWIRVAEREVDDVHGSSDSRYLASTVRWALQPTAAVVMLKWIGKCVFGMSDECGIASVIQGTIREPYNVKSRKNSNEVECLEGISRLTLRCGQFFVR
jgi:hypothetical protein